VGELLTAWLAADHGWRPSTISGYRSIVRFLTRDRIAGRRVVEASPVVVRAAGTAWREAGRAQPTIAGWVRCLRSAFGCAYAEGILDRNPLDGMRGPTQPGVRLHAPVEAVRAVLTKAENDVTAAGLAERSPMASTRLHKAEQVLLLARLAADSGARRGELAALQVGDLDGDVLTITRATSSEVVGATKTGRTRETDPGPHHRRAVAVYRADLAGSSRTRQVRSLAVLTPAGPHHPADHQLRRALVHRSDGLRRAP
jgi:integrase